MNKPRFGRVAIIGVGLIGGSIARVLKHRRLAGRIVGAGRGSQNLQTALGLGIVDEVAAPEKAVEGADLIVICTPVLSIIPTLEAIAPHVKKGALVTDAGSTKKEIVARGEAIANGRFFFVGSHPIAGTEKSGAGASFETLFDGKVCIVTPSANTPPDKLEIVNSLWTDAGMRVSIMDPEKHDKVLGAISHLPHMTAFALVNALAGTDGGEEMLQFAGGGFKDTTRIASSPPEMWADIAMANSDALAEMVGKNIEQLKKIESAIKAGDRAALLGMFGRANKFREKLR
ncbi:MAG: prephenate dehydrogenase/arogenate dehydrogenase family protein [Nitrospinae bacterium]|nr:prephenate dehydrogenase/arogenate dehydrogenase family protein [Nitrospinota bacterium]